MMTIFLTVHFILIIFLIRELPSTRGQQLASSPTSSSSFMSLISPKDIAELTQVATQFAAQTFKTNGDLMANSGPEVRPVSLDARPSEIFGQSLTNMLSPARQSLSNALRQPPQALEVSGARETARLSPEPLRAAENPSTGTSLIEQLAGRFLGGVRDAASQQQPQHNPSPRFAEPEGGGNLMGMDGMVGQAMKLLTGGQTKGPSSNGFQSSDGGTSNGASNPFPSLNQIFPGADKNFGFRQGEGCVPFIGEFMKMTYGNCVKQADEKTWDTWGKELNNALMGGKLDILRASKETCKRGAEREHCGQLRKAISECDILGSIQMATNLQRSVARCDEISGLMDQNPSTVFSQMNGLINGEMAQGLLNNFLG